MAENINIGGRLHSIATGNVVAGADEIIDDSKGKKQSVINTETYTLVSEINAKLDTLNPEQQSAMEVATKANNNEAKMGYYVCNTDGNVANKVVADATGYILTVGGSIKIKMVNENTAENATLNINSTGAKPLYYANDRVSSNNSWPEGSTVEVYYDGDNYYANNVISASGQLNVRVSQEIPGMLEVVSTTDFMDIDDSYMDEETGALNIVYNFE